MRSSLRPTSALALATALLLTGCADRSPELRSSERLGDLLLTADDYPEGYSPKPVDAERLRQESEDSARIGTVQPVQCTRLLEGGFAEIPEGAAEGAAQTAVNGDQTGYLHLVASGDLGEPDPGGFDALVEDCRSMRFAAGDTTLAVELRTVDSPALPESGAMFVMSMTDEEVETTMTAAWGRVGDVFFSLTRTDRAMTTLSWSDPTVPPAVAYGECSEDENPIPCMMGEMARGAEITDEDRRAAQDEFEEVLAAAVERLEAA